jgi:hypothetical protein
VAAVVSTVAAVASFGRSLVQPAPAADPPQLVPSAIPVAIPTPTSPATISEEQFVTITLTASPLEAKLYLDDEPLPSNPFSKRILPDSDAHVIRAQAPGYSARKESLSFDKDTSVILRLERTKATASTSGARRTSSSDKPQAASPKADCDPPFYIDDTGIRRVKVQCLSSPTSASAQGGQ